MVRDLARMPTLVSVESLFLGKALAAHFTHIGSLPCMNTDMFGQGISTSEALATVGADSGPLIRVCPHMETQVILGTQLAMAHFTLKLNTQMCCVLVISERCQQMKYWVMTKISVSELSPVYVYMNHKEYKVFILNSNL